MTRFIVQNCPCIEDYNNKAVCKNEIKPCVDIKNCVIKSILETVLLNKCSCLSCDDACEECMISESIKMSNDIIKRLSPKIMEEEYGD